MSAASCSLKYAEASTLSELSRATESFGIVSTGFGGRFTTSTVNVSAAVAISESVIVTATLADPKASPTYVTVSPLTLTDTADELDELAL